MEGAHCSCSLLGLLIAAVFAAMIPVTALAEQGGVLIVSPHPDDDVLIAAGVAASAVASGKPVKVVYMTNGDFWGAESGLVRERQAVEAQTRFIGTAESDLIFLGYPDGGMGAAALPLTRMLRTRPRYRESGKPMGTEVSAARISIRTALVRLLHTTPPTS